MFNRPGLKKDLRLTKKFLFSNTDSLKLKMKSISSGTDVCCQTCIKTLFHSDFKLKFEKKGNFFLILLDAEGWMGWSESIGPRQACTCWENFHIIYMLVVMSVLKNVLYCLVRAAMNL